MAYSWEFNEQTPKPNGYFVSRAESLGSVITGIKYEQPKLAEKLRNVTCAAQVHGVRLLYNALWEEIKRSSVTKSSPETCRRLYKEPLISYHEHSRYTTLLLCPSVHTIKKMERFQLHRFPTLDRKVTTHAVWWQLPQETQSKHRR